jgi:endonuclease YncB( thermonuclease family)
MRKYTLIALGLTVALVIASGVTFMARNPGTPPVEVAAQPVPVPPQPPVQAPPQAAGLPDLPVEEVAPRIVHAVPENQAPPPSPSQTASAAEPATPASASLSGMARATGPVSLLVDGHYVRLYGVRPPANGDRCSVDTLAGQPCALVAQEVLTRRLRANPTVNCRVPPGESDGESTRLCLDAKGVDLAGFLVAEGLVLADANSTSDYVGAESVARSYRKGLWLTR